MQSPKRLCVVPICQGQHFDLVHKFPMDNERAKSWLKILKIEHLLEEMKLEVIRKKRFVCTRHFQNSAYKNMASRSLNITAMPSINIDELNDPEGLDRLFPNKQVVLNFNDPPEILNNITIYEPTQPTPSNYNPPILQKVVLSKRVAIKRPIEKLEFISPTDNIVNTAKIFKSRNAPAPITKIQKIVKPILKNSTSTQTEIVKEEIAIDENIIEEIPSQPNKSKFLAIFECTPENILKLQKKLESTNGEFLDFDSEFLNDSIGEEIKEEDAASAMDKLNECLTIKNHETDQSVDINYFWLRDHCRCEKCYNYETNQRKLFILDIPEDVKPNSWKLEDSNLTVNWNDGHISVYAMDFILHSQIDVTKKELSEERDSRTYWNKEIIENCDEIARVQLNSLLCDDEMIKVIVKSLINFGVAFIEKVPPNQQSTEIAIKRIFPIHKTFFGEMWTFSDSSVEHSDTAYTKDFIGLHNDTTYFNDGCGLQILHCIQANGQGGETLIADGFKVAEDLKENDSELFERLCDYQIPAEYIEEGKHHSYCAPIFRKHPVSNELEQIRFNVYDRAVLNTLSPDKIPKFYADYRKLAKEINAPENIWQFKLAPGTVLILDNWRVLHGRTAYTGKRVMTGCYVSRTDYLSTARNLSIIS